MGIVYPSSSDLVKDGATNMGTIATTVDAKTGMVLLNTTTFSAVSSQAISTVFNTNFNNYSIRFNFTSSAQTDMRLRMRSGSTDESSANYWFGAFYKSFAGAVLSNDNQSTTSTSFALAYNSTEWDFLANLFNPFGSTRTKFDAQLASNTGTVNYYHSGLYNATTSYDGFTIFPVTGTITGSVSVYGFNK